MMYITYDKGLWLIWHKIYQNVCQPVWPKIYWTLFVLVVYYWHKNDKQVFIAYSQLLAYKLCVVIFVIFSIRLKMFQNLCQIYKQINHHWWYWRLDYLPLLIACGQFGIKSPKTYAKRSSLDTYKYISFTISLEQDQVPFNSIVVNTLLGWYYWHKVDEPISVAYNPFGIRSVKTYAKLSSLNHVKSLGVKK